MTKCKITYKHAIQNDPRTMKLIDFIISNIPDIAGREDYIRYLSLKECLSKEYYQPNERPCEYFQEYLKMKGELFNEAMENYLTKRGEGGVMK